MSENNSDLTDTVDPRVQIELERLNNATDNINKLEVDLDDARANFRELLSESSRRVEALRTKLGLCIEKSKPYYEARFTVNEALRHTQVAAMRYERANSAHSAAREMVYLAEQGLGGRTLDHAWQEMLNHATQRVNDAEKDRGIANTEHRAACVQHELATTKVQQLQKELKRSIAKSRPYYEMKAHFNQLLETQRTKIQNLETQVCEAKLTYSDALKNLEKISDEIHRTRNTSNCSKDDEYLSLPPTLNVDCHIQPEFEEISEFLTFPKFEPTPENSSAVCEWNEVDLNSCENDEIPVAVSGKAKLMKQQTLPLTDEEIGRVKRKNKLDSSIMNWISRSSAKNDQDVGDGSRRRSVDTIFGPTGEKVKEIFSQGIMMLNINSLTERRNSEPRSAASDETSALSSLKKIPSPLEKTLTYLTKEDDNSDSESLASGDMLSEEQINSLMLDLDLNQVLGPPPLEKIHNLNELPSSKDPE